MKYAAFLRGINLPGRRVKGAGLCAPLEGLGLEEVASFRASGNLVFEAPRQSVTKLTASIEKALEDALGYDVAVFLRTEGELRAIPEREPFSALQLKRSQGKLQVAMLPRKPAAKAREDVLALATTDDPLAFGERELYWLPRGGQMESDLDLEAIESLIGPTTRRTMGTIEALVAKF